MFKAALILSGPTLGSFCARSCTKTRTGFGHGYIFFLTFFPLPHDQAMTLLLALPKRLESVRPLLCYTHTQSHNNLSVNSGELKSSCWCLVTGETMLGQRAASESRRTSRFVIWLRLMFASSGSAASADRKC